MARRGTYHRKAANTPTFVGGLKSVFAWVEKPYVFRTTVAVLLVGLMSACTLVAFFKWSQQYPVRRVSVTASYEHLSPSVLRDSLDAVLKEINWINLNVEDVRSVVTSLSWVKSATVSKSWPDRISIEIEEPVPMAVWNKQWIMTMDGELVEIKAKAKGAQELPTLNGSPGRHKQASEFYQSLSTMLRSVDLKVVQYDMTTALQWRLVLENGVELIAEQDDYVQKVRRFVDTYMSLQDFQQARIARVDARYENGVAVRWKDDLRGLK